MPHVIGCPKKKGRFAIQIDENVWRMFQDPYGLDRRNLAWQAEEVKIAVELMERTGVYYDSQSRAIIDIGEDGSHNSSTFNNKSQS